jgi:hypothetical protein
MIAVTVHAGDTLSQIAQEHGVRLSALEAANPQFANPNLIYVGQQVVIPSGGSFTQWSPQGGSSPSPSSGYSASTSHSVVPSPVYTPRHAYTAPASTSSDLADVPGVPHAFAACVAQRESSNGANQAYNGGVYGIITASGVNVNGQSVAAQKAAFGKLYAQYGATPWAPSDGC